MTCAFARAASSGSGSAAPRRSLTRGGELRRRDGRGLVRSIELCFGDDAVGFELLGSPPVGGGPLGGHFAARTREVASSRSSIREPRWSRVSFARATSSSARRCAASARSGSQSSSASTAPAATASPSSTVTRMTRPDSGGADVDRLRPALDSALRRHPGRRHVGVSSARGFCRHAAAPNSPPARRSQGAIPAVMKHHRSKGNENVARQLRRQDLRNGRRRPIHGCHVRRRSRPCRRSASSAVT